MCSSDLSVPLSIVAFSDSDYASCRDTRHSVSGYDFICNGCAISWLSKKPQCVACSTTEAEYMALATRSRQAVCHLNAFTQLGNKFPITIMADNTTNINVVENPLNNPRTQQIHVACHFQKAHLIGTSFTLSYVISNHNTADLMNTGFNSVAHHVHTQRLELSEEARVLRLTLCSLGGVNTFVYISLISS